MQKLDKYTKFVEDITSKIEEIYRYSEIFHTKVKVNIDEYRKVKR